jgi:2-keto-4-pentenoate hydratase/2-oxohepta-3-ene-1,7-dioic acid hydratase in catechol pathway
MRLLRVGPAGAERPAVLDSDGTVRDVSADVTDYDLGFFASGGITRLSELAVDGTDRWPAVDGDQRVGAPIVRPSSILCIGLNYSDHAAESGMAAPTEPVVFSKTPNTLVGPHDDVLIPPDSERTDWEVELGVVIGRTARYVESDDEALACIGGYAISNDVSEREFQLERGGQWDKGKSCETFNPLGPYLVTADEVGDPQDLPLRSWVNGDPRQDSTTKDMIFAVGWTIWHLSQVTVLEPGDVINTGTPQGVALSGRFPYLRAGDVVEVEVAGLGRQRTECVAAPGTGVAGG